MDKFFFAFWWQPEHFSLKEKVLDISDCMAVFNLRPDHWGLTEVELHEELIKRDILYKLNPNLSLDIPVYNRETPPLWWILVGHEEIDSVYEWIFLLELYSGHVFTPVFIRDRLWRGDNVHQCLPWMEGFPWNQNYMEAWKDNKIELFLDDRFLKFVDLISPQIDAVWWNARFVNQWLLNNEDEKFRLQTALWLYQQIRSYAHRKSMMYWLKEAWDIWVVLEILLSNDRDSIEKNLRKRTKALLWWSNTNTCDIVHEIYDNRCDFVHGSFFRQLKEIHKVWSDGDLAEIDFSKRGDIWEQTDRWRDILRKVIIMYMMIYTEIQKWEFSPHRNIIEVLDQSWYKETIWLLRKRVQEVCIW